MMADKVEYRDAEDMMPTMLAAVEDPWSAISQPARNVDSSSMFHWKGMSNLSWISPSAKYCKTGTPPSARSFRLDMSSLVSDDEHVVVIQRLTHQYHK